MTKQARAAAKRYARIQSGAYQGTVKGGPRTPYRYRTVLALPASLHRECHARAKRIGDWLYV